MKKIAAIALAALLARGIKIVRSTILYSGPTPKKAYKTDAGYDLYAEHNVELSPGEHKLVSTGTSIALPVGWEAQIRPRSGLAAKHGVTVLNTPGTIDSGYRGEIKVNLINHGGEKITLHKGERIAQLVPRKLDKPFFVQVTTLPDTTDRGACGHGSTGR